MVPGNGFFELDENTSLQYDEGFEASAEFLKGFVEDGSGIDLKDGSGNKQISFEYDSTLEEEAYKLEVSETQISIRASDSRGATYAVQSLRQLMPVELENGSYLKSIIPVASVSIADKPRFTYRGMHLDVGRHMFSVDFIKAYIDALAMLKFNRFHWHLTEDQGWRIEIKKYPKLNKIASYRKETLIGHYSDQPHQFDSTPYGGFYTQDEIREIVNYASDRQITIIPEIEMPGHSQAVIAAYPELGCTGETVDVATKWGVFEHIYCTKEETFIFLEDVLDEVIDLFPSRYIHIGGDEAPKKNWKECQDCQARIAGEGLEDEHELQSYFISRMEAYLNSKGRQIIGWDEILEGGLAPNATVMSWRGQRGGIEAARMGHQVIMTPTSHCYFDYYQAENENEPLAIGGFLPLKKVYEFEPIPSDLEKDRHRFVIGAQGNVWTEYMPTEDQVEYMVFPRILALSEVLWSEQKKDYPEFVKKTKFFHKRLEALGINYADHLHQLEGKIIQTDDRALFEIKAELEGARIRYTLNGEEPSRASTIYTQPLEIDNDITIRAAVFDDSDEQIGSVFKQSIRRHKGFLKRPTLNVQPHPSYNDGGVEALTNGISGSKDRYGDSEWLGFWGDDLKIFLDLGELKSIKKLSTRFFNGKGQWIYPPKMIIVKTDQENKTLQIEDSEDKIIGIEIDLDSETRYVEISIPNFGMIPSGRQGAGNKAWTFIDEIIIQ